MPRLVLGPMLRYADASSATVWVETDGACDVEVLGTHARTFCVAGHHYAIVVVTGLMPGTSTSYDVRLDGELLWPEPDSTFPLSTIRTAREDGSLRLLFGSCRVTAPHHPPYTNEKEAGGMGVDALAAFTARMTRQDPADWPDALLFVGDQVYADEVSPQTRAFIEARRDASVAPGEQIADFEEYTQLYRESWSEPALRWLLSVVPTVMIFDDHDVIDDWNTSDVWRRHVTAQPWWRERIAGALMSYWLYQHLGNLGPQALATDPMLHRLTTQDDGEPLLRAFALDSDAAEGSAEGMRWSYRRDLGRTRLLVVDSRCGRVLAPKRRNIIDEAEWRWLEEQAGADDIDHLLIATSLPALLPAAIHHLEGWNEAVCAGAWGRHWSRWGEAIRQGADLEHWAAFRHSFDRLTGLLARVGSQPDAPASIVLLSGDVHFSYLTQAHFPRHRDHTSAVYQAVCSPVRNPINRRIQTADRFSHTRLGTVLFRALARSAGVRDPDLTWRLRHGPWFHNDVATLEFDGRRALLEMERSLPGDGSDPRLESVFTHRLADGDRPAQSSRPSPPAPPLT